MRRLICLAAAAVCFGIYSAGPGAAPAYGNSAPSYWEAFPYFDVLVVEEDSPIIVDREHLTFDFSQADYYYEHRNVMSPVGKVTAEYQMTNPGDDPITVQMAFPFVSTLYGLSAADITVSADGAAVPYETYIDANDINTSGDSGEDFVYDYGTIGDISNQERTLPGFDLDSKARLYRFAASSKEKPYLDFQVSFDVNQEQAFLIGKDFDGSSSYAEGRGTLSARIREKTEPEILVLGKELEYTYEVLTDEGEKADESLYQLEIIQDSVDPKEYLLAVLRGKIGEDTAAVISDTQLFNLFLHEIWQDGQRNGFSTLYEGFSPFREDRIFTLVYQVEFPAGSTKAVSVGYLTEGTMDRRETASPKYSYTYLLSPAENWADFGSLNVEIITPEKAPYVIESSLPFTRGGENRYSAKFDGLPDSELTFTLYKNKSITLIDHAEKAIASASYLIFFFWPVVAVILLFALIPVVIRIIRRKRSH